MLYKQVVSALTSALLVHSALATPFDTVHLGKKREIPTTHVLHERQAPKSRHVWQKRAKVHSEVVLPMRIGLHQRNLQEGHNLLMERSTPGSLEYGKRMTAHEVIDFFAPPKESVEAVRDWLVAGGIEVSRITLSANKQWIQFDATTTEVEGLLHTDFYHYQHGPTGTDNIAAEEYHIPAGVQEHIDYITPGTRLRADVRRRNNKRAAQTQTQKRSQDQEQRRSNSEADLVSATTAAWGPLNTAICSTAVVPSCIQNQYQIPEGTTAAEGNELGIFESLGQHYSQEDLDVYFTTLYPQIPNGTAPIERAIDGAYGPTNDTALAGSEADLDFEAAMPLIWPQRTVLFQADDEFYETNQTNGAGDPLRGLFNTFFDAIDGSYCTFSAYNETGNCVTPACLDPAYPDPNPGGYQGQLQCGVYEPTHVISISYDGPEAALPANYLKRQCAEIMKLGLQGTTVVMSSGDQGVGYQAPASCLGDQGTVFNPQQQAVCPYVLAVGSTELVKQWANDTAARYSEVATTSFPSGGGFSNFFDMPDYQAAHVDGYLGNVSLGFPGYTNISDIGDGVYRIGGRGYPDVSAIGANFYARTAGTWGPVGGTSLSAPIWASVLTLVNEERIADGKGPVGFVNPTLYAHPEVFHDVTEGSNPNCGSTGFLATKGWDPVTGLGTPIYPKLLSVLKALP